MQDKNTFDPKKMALVNFKMIKGQVETPEDFDFTQIAGHHLEHSFQFAFNLDEGLIKTEFLVKIMTDSKGNNEGEATGNFHLTFIYSIENLNKLAIEDKDDTLDLNPALANALSSVTYSTTRGILLVRLQGTALQNFILPIINPNDLLRNK